MDGEVARGKLSVQRDAGQDDAPDLE
jgi:hypothetical protein